MDTFSCGLLFNWQIGNMFQFSEVSVFDKPITDKGY